MGGPDIVLMYCTLVADGGLPSGVWDWIRNWKLQRNVKTGGSVNSSNMEASILLKQYKAQEEKRVKDAKTSADQFLLAAEMQPRRYMSRLQRSFYAGPTARKDAEEKERARAKLVRTPTSMGKVLGDEPGTLQL